MSASSNIGGFLQYEPQHKVLVCKDCQYAIQKSALDSHLLRHRIYRGQRQRLLHAIGKLDLLEPDDVQIPLPASLPVDNLPVLRGYRCVSRGCGALCTSEKWMKRHWLGQHQQAVHGALNETSVERVHLQTFFRGQKIKYFEVRLPSETTSGARNDSEQPSNDVVVSESDLTKLNYFHHFTSTTSPTLPPAIFQEGWCSQVLAQAFQQPSLMCGVLCIAAYHLHDPAEPMVNQFHLEQASSFTLQFLKWLDQVKRSSLEDNSSARIEGAKAGAQLMGLTQLCVWTISQESIIGQSDFLADFDLKAFISTICSCTNPNLAYEGLLSSQRLSASPKHGTKPSSRLSEHPLSGLPSQLAENLRTLPFRMAEALPKPDSAADFLATASSLNCLLQCFHLSFNGNDSHSTWRAMEEWFARIPKLFAEILKRDTMTPAALVVLGHWAVLVQRAERHYWFLAGSAVKIMTEVIGKLPQDEAAQSLVSGLLA